MPGRCFAIIFLLLILIFSMTSFPVRQTRAEENEVIETGNRKALILLPLKSEFQRTHRTVQEYLREASYDVDIMDDQNTTLESLKNLDQYSVIFLFSHGRVIHGFGDYYFATNIPYTRELRNQYKEDFDSGLLLGGVYFSYYRIPKVMVSATYLMKYNPHFPNTLFYAYTCHSMKNGFLANRLLPAGVKAVIGLDREGHPWIFSKDTTITEDDLDIEQARNWDMNDKDDQEKILFFKEATKNNISVEDAYNYVQYGSYAPPYDGDEVEPRYKGWVLATGYDPLAQSFYLNWDGKKQEKEGEKQEKEVDNQEKSIIKATSLELIKAIESPTRGQEYEGKTVEVWGRTGYCGWIGGVQGYVVDYNEEDCSLELRCHLIKKYKSIDEIPVKSGQIAVVRGTFERGFLVNSYVYMNENDIARNIYNALPDFKISAEVLRNSYALNRKEANLKYKYKIVVISGKVVAVIRDPDFENYVILENNESYPVVCVFKGGGPGSLPDQIKEGTTISIKGLCIGIGGGWLSPNDICLVNCCL